MDYHIFIKYNSFWLLCCIMLTCRIFSAMGSTSRSYSLVNNTVFNGECDTCSEVPQSLPLEALVDYVDYVMPVVTSDVRYGGSEPFIAVVKEDEVGCETSSHQGELLVKVVFLSCDKWKDHMMYVPSHVIDLIILVQCQDVENILKYKHFEYAGNQTTRITLNHPNTVLLIDSTVSTQLDLKSTLTWKRNTTHVDHLFILHEKIILDQDPCKAIITATSLTESQELCIPVQSYSAWGRDGDVFRGFHGVQLRVTTGEYTPFVDEKVTGNGTQVFVGYCIEITRTLSKFMVFRYTIQKNEQWGAEVELGVWNGLIGEIQRQEMDMAVTGMTISSYRDRVVDFTLPFYYDPSAVAIHLPSPSLYYLFKPLKPNVWMCIFIMVLLIGFLLAIIEAVLYRGDTFRSNRSKVRFHTIEGLWYATHAILAQCGPWSPRSQAGRTVASYYLMICVVLVATYSANLIAALTVQKISLPFETLGGLAQDTQYTILLPASSVQATLFKTSKEGVYYRLWEKMQRDPEALYTESQYGWATQTFLQYPDQYVTMGDHTYLKGTLLPESDCKSVILPEKFYPSGFGIMLPQNSPFKPVFDRKIRAMEEAGLFRFWEEKYFPPNRCDVEKKEKLKPASRAMTIFDVAAAFIILAIGVALSFLCCTLEIYCKKYTNAFCKKRILKQDWVIQTSVS